MHNVDYYKINSVVSPSYSVTKTMKFKKQCSYIAATIRVQDTIANLKYYVYKPSYSVIKTILP